MKERPCLLFYCQHSLGIGHLIRSLTLAEALSSQFRVVFLNGGRMPQSIAFPQGIEWIDLPPLGMDANNQLISHGENLGVVQNKRLRLGKILNVFESVKPDVVFIEMFPFGRKKFAFELLPLLKHVQSSRPKATVICSLRDILVNSRRDQQHHDDRAAWLVERYFDAVLVHSDPGLFRLEDSFRPLRPLRTPVYYTGFVVPQKHRNIAIHIKSSEIPDNGIVVSAGGGTVGGRLLRSAISAYPMIQEHRPIPMTVVAGPFMSDEEMGKLVHRSHQHPNLRVLRSVPNLTSILSRSQASISQCGYNTAMDILYTGTKALFVPYSQNRENEQLRRAKALSKRGISMYLPESSLSARTLADATLKLLDFTPTSHNLDLDGTYQTCAHVFNLYRWTHSGGYCEHVA